MNRKSVFISSGVATKFFWLAFFTIWLLLWGAQATLSAWCNDESAHLPAGLYHLETGRMDAYRVNPPLPRMIAAIPLVWDRPKIQWTTSESPFVRIEYEFAYRWVADNLTHVARYLVSARSTLLLFFGLGLWSIVSWVRELYGQAAALVAGAMWAFNPDVLTYSAVVAPDLPAAAAGLFVGYQFWKWLAKTGPRPFPWLTAFALAVAILCKFSWLFLLPVLPLVVLIHDWFLQRKLRDCGTSSQVIQDSEGWFASDAVKFALSLSLTIGVINWGYGFEGTGTQLGKFRFVSQALAGPDTPRGEVGNRWEGTSLAPCPVPFPKQMLLGLDYLRYEFEGGMRCYLRGRWQHGGWWYFHLYAMAVKIPIGYWILMIVGATTLLWDWRCGRARGALEWVPLLIAGLFLGLVSSQTGFTHHVRYVLPAYGFLFITASRVMVVLPQRLANALVVASLAGGVIFHATHLGLAHSFFNPAAGGPSSGWKHLSYSNVDWGQSTYRMLQWIEENPEKRPLTVLFRSPLGMPEKLIREAEDVSTEVAWRYDRDALRRPKKGGWFLLSSFQMTLQQNRYFASLEPIHQPYPDMLLFHLPAGNEDSQDVTRSVDQP